MGADGRASRGGSGRLSRGGKPGHIGRVYVSCGMGRRVMRKGLFGLAAVMGLSGCVAPPPPPPVAPVVPPQALLGAFPGPGKTEVSFRQDDAACQAAAARPYPAPLAGVPAPGAGGVQAGGEQPGAVRPGQGGPGQVGPGQVGPGQGGDYTPGMVYLRCMVVHGDTVQPVQASQPAVYAYYLPYPVYYGFGDYNPWLYGGAFDVAFFGGFYGGFGRFGYGRFGYGPGFGYRGFDGYRGGGGYGGFRGGDYGGFHGGGGGFGGGFHGGGGGGFRR